MGGQKIVNPLIINVLIILLGKKKMSRAFWEDSKIVYISSPGAFQTSLEQNFYVCSPGKPADSREESAAFGGAAMISGIKRRAADKLLVEINKKDPEISTFSLIVF